MTNLNRTSTSVRGRASQQRGKSDERWVAKRLGAERHWANSGGPEDLKHEKYAIQIKGGLKVTNGTVRNGLSAAQTAATGTDKLPVLVLVDRAGTRLKRYVVIDLDDWCKWEGIDDVEAEG